MNQTPNHDDERHDGTLQRAIAAVRQESVPAGPDQALIDATQAALRNSPIRALAPIPFIPRTRTMRLFTTAAALLVLATLTVFVSQVTHAPPSAFGNALMHLRGAKAMSYTEEIATEGKPQLVTTKSYVAEDGRKRTEQGDTATVFDATGHIRITLINGSKTGSKTAIVANPRPNAMLGLGHRPFLRWLEMLREIGDKPDKELGTKDFDGKPAKGYVATLGKRTFTLWVDEAGGQPVLIEYDSEINGKPAHITMRDFRFDEEYPESFFSFAVPPGYKVYGQPADGVEIATKGMEPIWSHKGYWKSVAGGKSIVYGLKGRKQVIVLDADGKTVATTLIENNRGASLCLAHLQNDEDIEFLAFRFTPENVVQAYRDDGTLLWSFAEQDAIDDVCAADLDGDGLDEVIIGYNGGTGLRVLSPAGELLWKDTSLGNVWHVTAGRFTGDGKMQVVTTSSKGQVHVFDTQGKRLQGVEPGFYANLVCTWHSNDDGKDTVLVAGGGKDKFVLSAIVLPGRVDWTVNLARAPSMP